MPIKRFGADLVVNTTADGGQIVPQVTGLADGGYVVIWRSDTADSDQDVFGRVFKADGSSSSSDFVLNSITAKNQLVSTVTALPDGGFVALWASFDAGDGSSSCIRMRLFGPGGEPKGIEFIANSTPVASQTRPAVTVLEDGRFAATWQSYDAGDGEPTCIRARLFDDDGSPTGPDFVVNTTSTAFQISPVITTLANGRFIVSWASEDGGDGSGGCVRGRIFNADGSAAGNDFILNDTVSGEQTNLGLTVLADGRLLVIFESDDAGDGSLGCIRARFLNPDGTPSSESDFIVNSTTDGNQADPKVAALADGRAVAIWYSGDTGDGSAYCVRARLFNVDGSFSGNDFIVNTIVDGKQYNPSVTALPDGRFVVVWQSDDFGDGDGTCIRQQIFDPTVFNGNAGGETWAGGNFADTIVGSSGADSFSGMDGDDVISGGGGNDILHGGAGADRLAGGAGNDIIYVNMQSDLVIETAGEGNADRVAASSSYALSKAAHVEFLRTTSNGGTAAIDLTGNALSQEILGNAGQNILHDGGKGFADVMKGLGGNDTYRVFNSADVIVEDTAQGASDRVTAAVDYRLAKGVHIELLTTNGSTGTSAIDLTGNEIGQQIIGNAGNNRLEGRDGSDILRGFAGHDTFVFNTSPDAFNVDTITDFNVVDDRFLLSDVIFAALTPGTLADNAFRANMTGLAEDADDRVIYENDTGKLFYDADGSDRAVGALFTITTAGLGLTSADFTIA